MKVNYGVVLRLASDPRTINTRTGNAMVSLFSVSNKRRKVNGRWEDDPRYEALKVNAIAFGDVAQRILEANLHKGDQIVITDGTIAKPRDTTYNDLEIIVYDFEALDDPTAPRSPRTSEPLPTSDDDLPF